MLNLIITLIIGIFGGTIALRLKIPAGAMVGSMILVSIFSITTGHAFLPSNIKILTQIAAGAFIGAGITKGEVLGLKMILKPTVFMVIGLIILNLFMGYIMHLFTGLDLVTCLFATAPGGIVDMSIISADLGADSSKVAVLQLVRLISVLVVFPPMLKKIAGVSNSNKNKAVNIDAEIESLGETSDKGEKKQKKSAQKYSNFTITIIIAVITGLIGYNIGVPAGAMTFAMISTGIFNIFTNRGYLPLNVRRLTQMFAGALVGERVTYADIVALKEIILPAIILLVGLIIVNLILGYLVSKTSKLELVTSLLASAPGGMSDMAIIAKDLGGDSTKVAILQLARYVSVIAFFPILIKFLVT